MHLLKASPALGNYEVSDRHGFSHRLNSDGSVDSICRNCFMTVATAVNEPALEEHESDHVCPPHLVDRFRAIAGDD